MVGTCRRRRLAWLAACAIIVAATLLFAPRPAEAQFVCGGSATGGEPQTGDGATATNVNGVACGTNAAAIGTGTTVFGVEAGAGSAAGNIGNSAFGPGAGRTVTGSVNTGFGENTGSEVTGNFNSAFGSDAGTDVIGGSNTAIGDITGTDVTGDRNAAMGSNAGRFVTGSDNIAIGSQAGSGTTGNPLVISNTVAVGTAANARADGASATGANSLASGTNSAAYGNASTASGASSVAIGDSAQATAASAIALGQNAAATGTNAIAIGTGAVATGSIAAGTNAYASNGGAAFGDFSTASGASSTAVGPNSTAAYDNSAAFGNGAAAVRANQQVFGTASNTYTMPGLTSSASKAAQGKPTHVVTSNANGDLAAYTPSELGLTTQGDLGAINRRLSKVDDEKNSGIALAVAMQNPDLTGSERIGVAANWGAFEDANALGMSVMGVLGHDFVSPGDRVAISGAFGVGLENGDGDDVYGGRVGLQWTH
jgi:hypothetical protein